MCLCLVLLPISATSTATTGGLMSTAISETTIATNGATIRTAVKATTCGTSGTNTNASSNAIEASQKKNKKFGGLVAKRALKVRNPCIRSRSVVLGSNTQHRFKWDARTL